MYRLCSKALKTCTPVCKVLPRIAITGSFIFLKQNNLLQNKATIAPPTPRSSGNVTLPVLNLWLVKWLILLVRSFKSAFFSNVYFCTDWLYARETWANQSGSGYNNQIKRSISTSVTWPGMICPTGQWYKIKLFPKTGKKHWKQELNNCQNLGSSHRKKKQKLTWYAWLTFKSCFVKEQNVLESIL